MGSQGSVAHIEGSLFSQIWQKYTMGRDKIALLFAILLASSYAMELQHAASAGRQLSPDPLTNALGIGFMTVAMIDGIHKIQGVLTAIDPNVHPIGLSLTESTTASSR